MNTLSKHNNQIFSLLSHDFNEFVLCDDHLLRFEWEIVPADGDRSLSSDVNVAFHCT